jgi:hypothetical protein
MTDSKSRDELEALLPCPFCGGEAAVRGDAWTIIECVNDQCISRPEPFNNFSHRTDAIVAWNRRDDAAARERDALADTIAQTHAAAKQHWDDWVKSGCDPTEAIRFVGEIVDVCSTALAGQP